MVKKRYQLILFCLLFVNTAYCQVNKPNADIAVVMRLIGHEVLLQSGDNTSQVLPIEKLADRYKISFTKEFSFQPEDVVQIINGIIEKHNTSSVYTVEIEECISKKVIYSYKIGHEAQTNIIPCRGREQPKGCYAIFFTILDHNINDASNFNKIALTIVITGLILLAGIIIMFKLKPKKLIKTIAIGQFQFDQKNLLLYLKKDIIELSGKESDLLFLLYSNVNHTVAREIILKEVWGDEGDYVGRTLDVFISKLRKKLADDPHLKIINIRGVGYKFIVNN